MMTEPSIPLYSSRVLNCHNHIDDKVLLDILNELLVHGAVHVMNTGIQDLADFERIRPNLGFCEKTRFSKGGRTTREKQAKWVTPHLRNMDYYPAHLYLLANNEVQYQRNFPRYVLFYCHQPSATGGRTFLHQAKKVEEQLDKAGMLGKDLLKKLHDLDSVFTVGYLCQYSTTKAENYFMSWQERFATEDIDIALSRAKERTEEIDRAWIYEEEHACSLHNHIPCMTLMTQITLPNFVEDPLTKERYLRFPRIAMTPPGVVNGHRTFQFTDSTSLTEAEQNLLKKVYHDTREGLHWNTGDFILFDNIRFGHSREPYTGPRSVLVGMANEYELQGKVATPLFPGAIIPRAQSYPIMTDSIVLTDKSRYSMPKATEQWQQRFSSRIFNAQGKLNYQCIQNIKEQFNTYGFLHVVNTGLNCLSPGDIPEEILDQLGFSEERQFHWGSLTSGRTERGYLSKYMRTVDFYPQDMFLLPHNEILYQHFMPNNLLFFYAIPGHEAHGGRTFAHSAVILQKILEQSALGEQLLVKLEQYGFLIESGFIDQNHPLRHQNYFRSWQERFATDDREKALDVCIRSKYQFDECWWQEEPFMDGRTYFTLMTKISVPAFKTHDADGRKYLLFPRIAYDGPMHHNGYRRFLLGSGQELSSAENELLLKAYWDTREGHFPQRGDIILIDNIRYAHSREPFLGERVIGITMSDITWSDKIRMQRDKSDMAVDKSE
jgi:hypothetical protein